VLIARSIGVLNKNDMVYLLKCVIRIEEVAPPPFIDHRKVLVMSPII
jgi:hypothetical protein